MSDSITQINNLYEQKIMNKETQYQILLDIPLTQCENQQDDVDDCKK